MASTESKTTKTVVVKRTIETRVVDGKHVRTETIVTTVDDPKDFDKVVTGAEQAEDGVFGSVFGPGGTFDRIFGRRR